MDSTISFFEQSSPSRQPVNTGVDLIVYDAWGRSQVHPMRFDRFQIGTAASDFEVDLPLEDPRDPRVRVVLNWKDGQLFFSNHSPHLQVQINGQCSSHRELFDGDQLVAPGLRLRVQGLRPPLATLEGYTPPHQGQRWLLDLGVHPMGRKGARVNQVELEDATVSRGHASLSVSERAVTLSVESASSQSKVNGIPVEVGHPRTLEDGDLLQLGRQLMRLRFQERQASPARPLQAAVLCIRFLCSAPLAQRQGLYQRAFACLDAPSELHCLPFDGETLVYTSFAEVSSHEHVDDLIDFAWSLRARWLQENLPESGLQLALALHVDTADQQPPGPQFASLRRTLEVAQALLEDAGTGESPLVLSRAAWEQSQRVTCARRQGMKLVLGAFAPVEAYYVDRI